jgi:Ca2+-binding RTX toxin-like protein
MAVAGSEFVWARLDFAGSPLLTATSGAEALSTFSQAWTYLYGAGGDDDLSGTFRAALAGGPGADRLQSGGLMAGGDGDDVLIATFFGSYALDGGPGDDLAELRFSSVSRQTSGVVFVGTPNGATSYGSATESSFSPPLPNLVSVTWSGIERFRIDATGLNDLLTGGAGDDQLNGLGGDDVLDGGPGADVLDGLFGADTLTGGDGDDVLQGGGQSDVMNGGGGDDIVIVDPLSGADVADGGPGEDMLIISPQVNQQAFTFTFTPNGTLGGAQWRNFEIVTIIGSTLNDVITAGPGNDLLGGSLGSDDLRGGSGDDILDGGPGRDRLFGEQGDDVLTIDFGFGDDELDGGDGIDRLGINIAPHRQDVVFDMAPSGLQAIVGSPGQLVPPADYTVVKWSGMERATFISGGGADRLTGAGDADYFNGGAGADRLIGAGGDDVLFGGVGIDLLDGGPGDDVLSGSDVRPIDLLAASNAAEALADLTAFLAADLPTFGWSSEPNTLVGGPGDDIPITSGAAQDRLDGGDGVDLLVLTLAAFGSPEGVTLTNPGAATLGNVSWAGVERFHITASQTDDRLASGASEQSANRHRRQQRFERSQRGRQRGCDRPIHRS